MWSPIVPADPGGGRPLAVARPVTARKREVVIGTGAVLAATALVGVVSPYRAGHYPVCPLYTLTGLYCPFCGGLRAAHDIAHLNPAGAWDRNPLVLVALPFAVWAWTRWVRRSWGRRVQPLVLPRWWGSAVLALVVVFSVLRNLPGWSWLSPA